MIIHCSRKLAAKLPGVSPAPLEETSPLGSWHGHLYTLDRRQCVMFCHDATRFVLFKAGLRKEHFAELGRNGFRDLYSAALAGIDCPRAHINKVELAIGPVRYDSATDRSVQGSQRVAMQDLEAWLYHRVPNVMDLDPTAVARRLNARPARVRSKLIWPDKAMREMVATL